MPVPLQTYRPIWLILIAVVLTLLVGCAKPLLTPAPCPRLKVSPQLLQPAERVALTRLQQTLGQPSGSATATPTDSTH